MKNKSLLETNVYRKPHEGLGEYTSKNLRDSFNCQIYNGWYSCDEGYGKVYFIFPSSQDGQIF